MPGRFSDAIVLRVALIKCATIENLEEMIKKGTQRLVFVLSYDSIG